jgi:hypothetical protein
MKDLITEPILNVHQKFIPDFETQNTANFIFTSNNAYPIKAEVGDRRYMVLTTNGD